MKNLWSLVMMGSLAAASGCLGMDELAGEGAQEVKNTSKTVTYSGQGLWSDGFGGYDLNKELCGIENGADADGPYLLWVLTATQATSASISGPWGTANMTAAGNGTFKFVSGWYDPDALPGNVSATYAGKLTNAQLVISHGCRPFTEVGAWCSPGFWRNAEPGAWALTGHARTDLFNTSVYDVWYGATFVADPTLDAVLATPQIYSGAPLAGTSGYSLNAFNATGAMLTDALEGFAFSEEVKDSGSSEACPIDHFGHVKN